MKVICKSCKHQETVDKDFFLKVLGGVVSGFGFWSWTAFLFAGTGFAMPIVIAIIAGGGAIATYSKEITEWLIENHECEKCGKKDWIDEEQYKALLKKEKQLEEKRKKELQAKEKEHQKNIKEKEAEHNATKAEKAELEAENEDLYEELDKLEKEKIALNDQILEIEQELKNTTEDDKKHELLSKELEKLKNEQQENTEKQEKWHKRRFLEKRVKIYSNIDFKKKSLTEYSKLTDDDSISLEKKLGLLQYNPDAVTTRCKIQATKFLEIGFGSQGRMYVLQEGNQYHIYKIGNKNTQNQDINYLKSLKV